MEPSNPIKLGMRLSYSVQYYEMLGNKEKAIEIAQQALQEA